MKYKLEVAQRPRKRALREYTDKFLPLFAGEKGATISALAAIVLTSLSSLIAPILISRIIDKDIQGKNLHGLTLDSLVVLAVYAAGGIANYLQVKTMGGIGRRVLFHLRNQIFMKLQDLPVAFFNENKAGDLISRVNNDTDKLNQFVSQALMQFVSSTFLITGAAIFLVSSNVKLGFAALAPALGVLVITRATSAWIKKKNLESLQSLGGMSSEVQESLNNFKVIVAFNRVDYFRSKFEIANHRNYAASLRAGIANNVFMPLYGLAQQMAQLMVVAYGIYLVQAGQATVGLLVGFLMYVNNLYGPLRQLASVWASFQMALAALDRISEVLALDSDLPVIAGPAAASNAALEFHRVRFHYPGGKEVLREVSFEMETGKSYALVGPTGGGKTTTANLMARLYDPTDGAVLLQGRDIRSYTPQERTRKIGFILQDPFLFSGSVRDNIVYGNDAFRDHSIEEMAAVLERFNLSALVSRFPEGLETKVTNAGNSISLGQKQLIAFMRAVLRSPDLLILDEATANIDTVTEELLQDILLKLPPTTTRVIIAHRLNTIENVDQIFFVNTGEIALAGSMEHAVDMLLHQKRAS
jgi:ATP-binding cassette, subfamily B, bacterial